MKAHSITSLCAILGFSALMAVAGKAHAYSAMNNVKIVDITIEGTTTVRVAAGTTASRTGTRPACSDASYNAGYTIHYAFDISSPKGKALLAMLQSALLSGKSVTLNGPTASSTGTCTALTGGTGWALETLDSMTLAP